MNVDETQRKLARWAAQRRENLNMGLFASRKDLRLHDLYHLLYDPEWLFEAYHNIRSNAGSKTAGCDGINFYAFEQRLEENLRSLADELKRGSFEPYPVRRVYIPKANGKLRPLGIPSVRDRIVQEALRMVLEPIFEGEFHRHSYGFRPNRSTKDALHHIGRIGNESSGYRWVIEGDIKAYFDTINHRILLSLLRRRIRDEKLLHLVWLFLRAGVMENKLFKPTEEGTPQGGIISPLLANVFLHELDMFMSRWTDLTARQKLKRRERGVSNFMHIRYADDFVVMTNGTKRDAEAMRDRIKHFLTDTLKLTLSVEKTKITHINDGFRFLGFDVERSTSGKGKLYIKLLIPAETVRNARAKINRITSPTQTGDSVHAKFAALNAFLRGWANHFHHGYNRWPVFDTLDSLAYCQLVRWLARKFQCKCAAIMHRQRWVVDGRKTLGYGGRYLWHMNWLPRKWLRGRKIPNAYEQPDSPLVREASPLTAYSWTGYEVRPGSMDAREACLVRDGLSCAHCGRRLRRSEAFVDHIRPVRHYSTPEGATFDGNLQTLCRPCHSAKGKIDRRMESRVQGNLHARFGEGGVGNVPN